MGSGKISCPSWSAGVYRSTDGKNSPFECVGFEIHPGAYPGEYDTPEFWRGFLNEMESYGKKIYIWELAVKSHGVPDPTPKWYPTWVPPVDEYTEEYQERVFMEVFKMFIDDPQIVGVALLDYCDDPPELNRESVHFLTSMQAGLLRSDKTQKPL